MKKTFDTLNFDLSAVLEKIYLVPIQHSPPGGIFPRKTKASSIAPSNQDLFSHLQISRSWCNSRVSVETEEAMKVKRESEWSAICIALI